jgi:PAS domain S-box-containing protein
MYPNKLSQMNSFEHIGLPVVVFAEDYTIVSVNQIFLQLFQCDADVIEARTFSEIVCNLFTEDGQPLPSYNFAQHCFDPANSDIQISTIGIHVGPTEMVRWFRVVCAPDDKQNNGSLKIVVSFTDVTELISTTHTHRQIAQAKNEWETTVDALQDIVTIQNMDMEISRANKYAHDLFGFELGELKNRKCYEVFFKHDIPCVDCPVMKTGKDGCPHSGFIYHEQMDKTFRVSSFPILNEVGEMHQLVHVAKDVSQYLQDESEKNRLMAAIEQTSESVVMTDIDANIQYVNPAFENVSGYSREEIVGKNTKFLKSGEYDAQFYRSMWTILLAKKVWRGKLKNRHKDGSIYTEAVTISPVLDSDSEIVNFVALKRDVTREEQLEQQLQHATKIEALGTLAGGIAHDFNNILSSMIGYGEIAKGKLDLNHTAYGDIEQILDGGDRAVDLVKQILTFGRRETSGEFHLVKLQNVVREIIEFLRPTFPPTIEFIHEIDETCGSVYADPSQLYQVIMNLCTNSRQAIGEAHGTIKIKLTEVDAMTCGAVFPVRNHNCRYLLLEVIDNGCGIKEENLANVFDPFYTTKQKEQGTGLGLSVVHGIVKKHKGEIQITSKLGQGTTFSIYLAIDGRDPEKKKKQSLAGVGGNERIMIIDDEPQVANILSACLERVGYRVTSYCDSIKAVMDFRENPNCCDLVITDMLMPNMTGAELSREMLSIRKELPIIMVTGYSEHFDREKAQQIGLKDYLFKPVKNEKLRTIVRKVLNNGENIDH